MLNKTTAVLQFGLNASLLLAYLIVFVLSIMGVADNRYAFLLEIEGKRSVINLSIPIMLSFGMWILFYTFYFVWKIVVWTKNRIGSSNTNVNFNAEKNFYVAITCIMVNVITGLCWMLFAAFQIYVFKNGHLPTLDVLYRHYDLESVCWNSIVYLEIDYENAEILSQNCVYENLYKKCIMCRAIVRDHEPTVFNQNYSVIIMGVLTILAVQCWNLYVQLKEMRHNIYIKRRAEAEKASYDHYCDIDYCLEEERESNSKLLEVVSEGRNSSSVAAVTHPPFTPSTTTTTSVSETLSSFIALSDLTSQPSPSPHPSSPFGNHNEFYFGNTYSVPKPVYNVPKKVLCTTPDGCTMCQPPLPDEEIISRRTPTFSPKLLRKSKELSPVKPVKPPTPPVPTAPVKPPTPPVPTAHVPTPPVKTPTPPVPTPPPMCFSEELQRKFKERKLSVYD
uniref:ARIF-1 n=1 Tax=Bombyx mori nuclear polyhedrosis virus TaxID=271108 RepID=K9LQU8_NPVBM|nr:ARIF-1 [Bombyx mori nucleopolyhedrovirus]